MAAGDNYGNLDFDNPKTRYIPRTPPSPTLDLGICRPAPAPCWLPVFSLGAAEGVRGCGPMWHVGQDAGLRMCPLDCTLFKRSASGEGTEEA